MSIITSDPLNDESLDFSFPSFECHKGWYRIINGFLLCMDRYVYARRIWEPSQDFLDFSVIQIKEKFGGLRIYCSYEDDYIKGVIGLAEIMAYNTCEISGEPGFLHQKNGWFKTLSPSMASQMGFDPAERNHRIVITKNAQRKETDPS